MAQQDHTIRKAIEDAQSGRIDAGIAALRLLLRRQPQNAEAMQALGRLHTMKGELEQSLQQMMRSVQIAPKIPAYRTNLANALLNLGRYAEAAREFREALAVDPNFASGWLGLSLACLLSHDSSGAVEAAERGLKVVPEWPDMTRCYAGALEQADRLEDSVRAMAPMVAQRPHDVQLHSRYLLGLNYLSMPPSELAAAHKRFRAAATAPPRPPKPARDPERPLRVGVLSGDLRTHSVGYFVEPFVRGKPAGVTLVAFNTHPPIAGDRMEALYRGLFDEWVEVAPLDDATLDRTIREKRIDILLELGGHTMTSRIAALDQKPAPVVVTAIGYPNTTGHAAVDWRLVDSITDPPGSEPLSTERLLRLDPCFLCYAPPKDAPEPTVPPSDAPITFGSFNLTTKISSDTIRLWRRVLDAVPGSRLMLKSKTLGDAHAKAHVLARLEAGGIDPARVEAIAYTASAREHLELYGRIHIGLDTMPYNGTTTTCEALWMGVPVVVLEGDRHAARVGASLLRAAGAPELVAADEDAYCAIVRDLVSDRAKLEALRAGLRGRLAASPLLDAGRYGERFHAALRGCWREWCRANP